MSDLEIFMIGQGLILKFKGNRVVKFILYVGGTCTLCTIKLNLLEFF